MKYNLVLLLSIAISPLVYASDPTLVIGVQQGGVTTLQLAQPSRRERASSFITDPSMERPILDAVVDEKYKSRPNDFTSNDSVAIDLSYPEPLVVHDNAK